MNFLKDVGSWVFLPEEVKLEISDDGINYTEVARHQFDNSNKHYLVESVPLQMYFEEVEARYLKITALSMKTCPEWHRGYGMPSWIFIDEMILN
jgi:hexosaminidase